MSTHATHSLPLPRNYCTACVQMESGHALLGFRQVVRHGILVPICVGSSPTAPAPLSDSVVNNGRHCTQTGLFGGITRRKHPVKDTPANKHLYSDFLPGISSRDFARRRCVGNAGSNPVSHLQSNPSQAHPLRRFYKGKTTALYENAGKPFGLPVFVLYSYRTCSVLFSGRNAYALSKFSLTACHMNNLAT